MAYMRDRLGRRLDSIVTSDRSEVFRNQLVPVGTDAAPPFDPSIRENGTNSSGTASLGQSAVDVGGTAKLAHVAVRTCTGIRLAFVNWFSGTANTEQDTGNAITVRASVEYPATLMFPVTFNGSREVTLQPGATVLSDPVGVVIDKGVTFYTRTYVAPAAGGRFPRSGFITNSSGEGNNYATPVAADLTPAGSATLTGLGTNQAVYGPASILGIPTDPGLPVLAIVGDSIAQGSGDTFIGWPQRALAGNYSFQKVAFPGEPLAGWTGSNGSVRSRRLALLARAGITHVLGEHLVNELSVGTSTVQTRLVTYWRVLARLGPAYGVTCTPQTTSTDSWATVANQTVTSSGNEATRLAVNAWLRDGAPIAAGAAVAVGTTGATVARCAVYNAAGAKVADGSTGSSSAPHPLAGILDVADAAESARDSGKWKAGFTSDGTHPNPTGAAALAACFVPGTLLGPPSS